MFVHLSIITETMVLTKFAHLKSDYEHD
jgi:hypothetical protein